MTPPGTPGKAPVAGIKQYKVFGLPVDREIIFSNFKNKYKPRIEKRQRKLITKISFVRPFLEPDETILLVTTGHSPPTVLEKLGVGWLFLYLKRSLLVFTDRRIFHIPTTSIYRYRNTLAQIRYASCESIEMKGSSLVIQYKGGEETEKFISLSGREKKKIRTLLTALSFEGEQPGVARRVHLCPQCAAQLNDAMPACRKCGLTFKTATAASLFAILLPGGGYVYLRQPFLGFVTAVLEIAAAALIGISVTHPLHGTWGTLLWSGGGIVMLCLVKAFAVVHARVIVHEFIPRTTDITFQTVAAATG